AFATCALIVNTTHAQAADAPDPFLQATDGMPSCTAPQPPTRTPEDIRAEAHSRAERGTRCYLEGHCRLPNAYQYDAEIVPRVKKAILYDGRFASSSIWIEGRRRWVWLKGCVRRRKDIAA